MSSAVALLSGGLDSTVAVALWLERGNALSLCLTADYGQRSAAKELMTARALAERFGAPWSAVPLPWLGEAAAVSGSALVDEAEQLPMGTPERPGDDASAARVWVPARNVVLLAVAAAYADSSGADCVLAGFNREEAATFPDNSDDFAAAMTKALSFGTRDGVRVESPTSGMEKPEIAAAALRLGIPRDAMWSCYGAGPDPCGRCESCLRSDRAFA